MALLGSGIALTLAAGVGHFAISSDSCLSNPNDLFAYGVPIREIQDRPSFGLDGCPKQASRTIPHTLPPAKISRYEHDARQDEVHTAQYGIRPEKAGGCGARRDTPSANNVPFYAASNPAQQYRTIFSQDGIEVAPAGAKMIQTGVPAWRFGLRLMEYGYAGGAQPVSPAVCMPSGPRMEYRRGDVVEWYVNKPKGLEQGFTLSKPPSSQLGTSDGKPLLVLNLTVTGALTPETEPDGLAITLRTSEGKEALRYRDLMAFDADGRSLPCHLATSGNIVSIHVDDAEARYPILIDPLISNSSKLVASDAAALDLFGYSVSVSGNTAIVGAYGENGDRGAAYVFDRDTGGAWTQVRKLVASDAAASDLFGYSVAISGEIAIVGAVWDDDNGADSGSAYIFYRNQGGANNWGQVKKVTASDGAAGDDFGWAVAISGDTAVVGAIYDDDNGLNRGSAYIFGRNQGGADNWGQVIRITASDGTADDYFGGTVSVSGDDILVGAWSDDPNGTHSGSAYMFSRNQGGANNWGQLKKITPTDGAAEDLFGYAVSVSGDYAVIGSIYDDDNGSQSGSAYVFSRNLGGANNWGQVKKLTASDAAAGNYFGSSAAISGDFVLVGAVADDDAGAESGSAYVFERNLGGANNWGQVQKLTASDAAAGDRFGGTVAISGVNIVVGAYADDDGGNSSGSAYAFQVQPPDIVSIAPTHGPDTGGTTVTITGQHFVSGMAVTFAGVSATNISVDSATSISCRTPSHAVEAVDVTVSDPDNHTDTLTSGYTYHIPVPEITSPTTASATVGQAFSYSVTASNSPTSFGATGLPSWLSFDAANARLSGTATQAGPVDVGLSATNAGGTGTATLRINVVGNAPAITSALTATGTVGSSFSYTIVASGLAPLTFKGEPLPQGLSLSGAVISGTPVTAEVADVTISAQNSAGTDTRILRITINPTGAPTITSALTASGTVGAAFAYSITASGNTPMTFGTTTLPTGLSLSSSSITGNVNAAGTYSIGISASNSLGTDSKTLLLSVQPTGAPLITSSLTPTGKVNQAFSCNITASGAATISFTASGLPSWLSLSGATLSGTPSVAGNFSIEVTASNSIGSDTRTLNIKIAPESADPPVITDILVSRNPCRTNSTITFTAQAVSLSGFPLSYSWYFFLGTARDGQILAGQTVSRSFSSEAEYTAIAVASDGFSTSTQFQKVTVTLEPNSGGLGVNISDGKPEVTNPENGLGVKITASDAGVLDVDVVAGASPPANETYECDFSNSRANSIGLNVASKYTNSHIFVANIAAKQNGTKVKAARRMIPVSRRETGENAQITAEPSSKEIANAAMRGRCTFGSKIDQVVLTGEVELPEGLDLSAQQEIAVGIGNVVDTVRMIKGRRTSSLDNLVRKMTVKWPRLPRGSTKTQTGAKARIAVTLNAVSLDEKGFDTEGITRNVEDKTPTARKIQVAIIVGGVSYESLVPVTYLYIEARGMGSFISLGTGR